MIAFETVNILLIYNMYIHCLGEVKSPSTMHATKNSYYLLVIHLLEIELKFE